MRQHKREQPVFIVGCYRSGTTLLSSILSAHSEAYIPEETRYLPYIFERLDDYGDLRDDANLTLMINDINRFLIGQDWEVIPDAAKVIGALSERTFQEVIRCIAVYNADKPVRVWGDNTPFYVSCALSIASLLPDARFINMVRDGRDVAASAIKLNMGGGFNPTALALEWNERILDGMIAQKMLGPEKVLTVRYEDIVSDTRSEINKVCSFLGIAFEESMLDFHQRANAHKIKKQTHHANLSRPVTSQFVGNYKKAFSQKDILLMERMMRNGLMVYGYEITNKRLAPISNSVRYRNLATNFLRLLARRLTAKSTWLSLKQIVSH